MRLAQQNQNSAGPMKSPKIQRWIDLLAALLRGRNAHVNLIPMNGVTELPFDDPGPPRTHRFRDILDSHGIPATIRKRKGADIDAACGQLRLQHERETVALATAPIE